MINHPAYVCGVCSITYDVRHVMSSLRYIRPCDQQSGMSVVHFVCALVVTYIIILHDMPFVCCLSKKHNFV